MPNHLKLGERIREVRLAKRMTLLQLARIVGVSVSFISELEHGRRGTTKIAKIEKALRMDPGELEALNGRLDPELAQWILDHPEVHRVLRQARLTPCGIRIDPFIT